MYDIRLGRLVPCGLSRTARAKPGKDGDGIVCIRNRLAVAGKSGALTHFDPAGQAHMVDVGAKPATERRARAAGAIVMTPATLAVIQAGSAGKGDVLGVARVAAIMAAKRTAELIPLCHAVPLSRVAVDFTLEPERSRVLCTVTVQTVAPTGVEMEALLGVQIGLLTIYDMCKSIDRAMVIGDVRLIEKQGGASGHWTAEV